MVCTGHANSRWQYVPRVLYPISLPNNVHNGVLCLLRVHALYGRSGRVLGLLVFLATGAVVTAIVGRSPLVSSYACFNILLLPIKTSLLLSRNSGGETIPVISSFVGCAQYTPHNGYVADHTCGSSSGTIRLITLVLGVDVSPRVNFRLLTVVTRAISRCYRMDWRTSF